MSVSRRVERFYSRVKVLDGGGMRGSQGGCCQWEGLGQVGSELRRCGVRAMVEDGQNRASLRHFRGWVGAIFNWVRGLIWKVTLVRATVNWPQCRSSMIG